MLKLLWIFGLSFWFPVTGLSLLCTVHQWSSEYSWKIQGKEVTILHILEIKLLLACGYIWCSTESIINHYLFNHIYIYICTKELWFQVLQIYSCQVLHKYSKTFLPHFNNCNGILHHYSKRRNKWPLY